jgi:hypothetical protein
MNEKVKKKEPNWRREGRALRDGYRIGWGSD